MNVALITGINGQDGSYLAEFLLHKGYRVIGTIRRGTSPLTRIEKLLERVEIAEFDLNDRTALGALLQRFRPNEFYNLAARASSAELWNDAVAMAEINGVAVASMLEMIRHSSPQTRFCQASSSEVFGNPVEVPQSETTPLHPRNPYGAAKAYAQWITAQYRQHYNLFACSAILFNHESPRRGAEFVTRKICRSVARISRGLETQLCLGDLDVRRDWGFAGDYMEALWRMLQQPKADDYVVGTGEAHAVREFCECAFSVVGLNYADYVIQDIKNFRKSDNAQLVANPTKAMHLLGWRPSVSFKGLVTMMVEAEVKALDTTPPEAHTLACKR